MSRSSTLVRLAPLALLMTLTACGTDDAGSADGAGNGGQAGNEADAVEVVGTEGLTFEPSSLEVPAGEVSVTLTSERTYHDFVIEELGDLEVVDAAADETNTETVELEPGTYTFYCSVPGHRSAGMEGTLAVE